MIEELTREAVLERLARHIAALACPHPVSVALGGRTAAGKATLVNDLIAPLAALGRPVLRVALDDFHLPRSERRGRGPALTSALRYYEHTFDHPAIRSALLPLGPGGDRRYRRAVFDRLRERPIDEPLLVAPPDAIVLVDGVFLQRPELDDLWDLRIFVEIDAEDSLRRGPARGRAWRCPVDETINACQQRYIPGGYHYIDRIRPAERADVVVDHRDPKRIRLRFRTGGPLV